MGNVRAPRPIVAGMTNDATRSTETDPGLVADRYRTVRPIGQGGMGTVWLATDERLGRSVAIKRLAAVPGAGAADARALREARHAAALNHPNVVSVFDVVQHEGSSWLVMEHVDGPTLAQAVRDRGPLRPRGAADLGAQLAAALAAAHAAGVVHRDIKPANVLIGDRRAKLADFGTARAGTDEQHTGTGLVTGTPTYMAPEVADGHPPTEASDLWALGATLYLAVEGRDAYSSRGNALATLRHIATTDPEPAQQAGALGPIIERLMSRIPGERGTAAQVRDELRLVAEGEELPTAPVTTTRPPRPAGPPPTRDAPPSSEDERRPGRLVPWLVGAVVLVLLAGLAAALLRDRGAEATSGATPPPAAATTATSEPTTSTSEPSSESPSEPDEPAFPADEVTAFVAEHYSRLASDPATSWDSLTPEMQQVAGGEQAYTDLWSAYSTVAAEQIEVDEESGRVTFTLSRTKGSEPPTTSRQAITVVRAGDGLRIAATG